MNQSFSELMLESYVNGDLPDDDCTRLTEALKSDPKLQAKLDAIRESNARTLERFPAAGAWNEVERRLKTDVTQTQAVSERRPFMPLAWATGATALVCLVVVSINQTPVTTSDAIRTKGLTPQLELYVERQGQEPGLYEEDKVLTQGDTIQVVVRDATGLYALVVSLDARGVMTSHYPKAKQDSVIPDSKLRLPQSYRLDDAPRYEAFYLLTSNKTPELDVLSDALQSAQTPAQLIELVTRTCPSCTLTSVTVRKPEASAR